MAAERSIPSCSALIFPVLNMLTSVVMLPLMHGQRPTVHTPASGHEYRIFQACVHGPGLQTPQICFLNSLMSVWEGEVPPSVLFWLQPNKKVWGRGRCQV